MARQDDAIEVAGVRVSSPDRVLYTPQGITKRQLAEYYVAVADRILPELKDRPLTLVRCPQGQEKECFYQRRVGEAFPAYMRRVPVDVAGEEDATHVAVDSLQGVIYLVQIGVLEVHTWGARRDRLDRPDRLVFDLDPAPGLPFRRVIDAALQVRARLAGLGLQSFVKTTGGKGLHVVAPIARTATWDEAKAFSRALAEEMERLEPRRFLAEASKKEREGKIYVDYLRNGHGATAVAAYSTRARQGAPVSTPLTWAELEKGVDPGDFTVLTVPERISRQKKDPWAEYASTRQRLTRSMRLSLGAE